MTNELPVIPWEDRTSNYQTEIFSDMERMQSEIDEWREYFRKARVDLAGVRRYDLVSDFEGGQMMDESNTGDWIYFDDIKLFVATSPSKELP